MLPALWSWRLLGAPQGHPPADRGTGNPGRREFAIVMAESKKTYVWISGMLIFKIFRFVFINIPRYIATDSSPSSPSHCPKDLEPDGHGMLQLWCFSYIAPSCLVHLMEPQLISVRQEDRRENWVSESPTLFKSSCWWISFWLWIKLLKARPLSLCSTLWPRWKSSRQWQRNQCILLSTHPHRDS